MMNSRDLPIRSETEGPRPTAYLSDDQIRELNARQEKLDQEAEAEALRRAQTLQPRPAKEEFRPEILSPFP